MANTVVKVPWSRKPPDIDLRTKLRPEFRRDLRLLVSANERSGIPVENVLGESVSWNGTEAWTRLPDGSTALQFGGSNAVVATIPNNIISSSADFTFVWVGIPRWDGTDREGLFAIHNYAPGVFMGAATNAGWGIYHSGWDTGTVKPVNGKLQTVIYTRRNSNDNRLFVDGQQVASRSISSSFGVSDLWIGAANFGSFAGNSECAFLSLHDERWSEEKIRRVSADPWGELFKPTEIPVFLPAAALSGKPYHIDVPWTTQPPSCVHNFDKGNAFGARCLAAFIPGWDTFGEDAGGGVRSVGQNFYLEPDKIGTAPRGDITNVAKSFGGGVGVAKALQCNPANAVRFIRLLNDNPNKGFRFPNLDSFTVVSIVRLEGDGRAVSGGGDPRIFSQDEGTGAADHDLMIGIASTGTAARSRIRVNGTTQTVLAGNPQDDAINLMACGVRPHSPTQSKSWCRLLTEDGAHSSAEGSATTGSYDPRTSTDMAIGGTAGSGSADNAFNGDVIGIWFLDGDFSEDDAYQFMRNPWQVFEPQRISIYPPGGGGGGPIEASGAAMLEPLEAAGTAKVRKPASGAADVPILTAAGLAKVGRSGSGAATLEQLIPSGTAKVHSKASGDISLPVLTASGATKLIKPASGDATLPILEAAATAKVHSKASGDVALPKLEAAGVASVIHSASGAADIPLLTASGSASKEGEAKTASGAAVLPKVESSGTANVRRSGGGAATIPTLMAAGTAKVRRNASGSVTLPIMTASGTANAEDNSASGAAILPMLAAAGTATVRRNALGAAAIPAFVAQHPDNQLLYSEDFSTTWNIDFSEIDPDVALAPDGQTTMDRLNVDVSNNRHRVFQQITSGPGQAVRQSIYAKDDGARYVWLNLIGAGSDWVTVVYDLVAGTVTDNTEATTGILFSSDIIDVGGGIYRLEMIAAVDTANAFFVFGTSDSATPVLDSAGQYVHLPNEGDDVFMWGAQISLVTNLGGYAVTTDAIAESSSSGAARVHSFAYGAAVMPILVAAGNSSVRRFASGSAFIPSPFAAGNVVVGGTTIFGSISVTGYEIEVSLDGTFDVSCSLTGYEILNRFSGFVK